jgi:hypothetical protein
MSAIADPPLIYNPNDVPRSRLTAAIDAGPLYLRPIFAAIRDAGVACCVVPHGGAPFDPPTNNPTIALIDDYSREAKGPQAFHQDPLRSFVKRYKNAVISSCEPLPAVYFSAATLAAVMRRDVTIVETSPEHVADWEAVLNAISPDLACLLCLIDPAGGIQ